jgi:hypothetical protein
VKVDIEPERVVMFVTLPPFTAVLMFAVDERDSPHLRGVPIGIAKFIFELPMNVPAATNVICVASLLLFVISNPLFPLASNKHTRSAREPDGDRLL